MSKMIAVTMGDPAGIGPEIIIKSLAEGALSGAPVVVVGVRADAAADPGAKYHTACGAAHY